MARPGVTYLDIAKTATQLAEQGHYPSIEAIRNVLGTGSHGTISRHLKTWREKQGNPLEAEKGLPETLLVEVKGLYEAVNAQAEQRIDKIKQEFKERLGEVEKSLSDVRAEHDVLLKERDLLKSQLNAEQDRVERLERDVVQRDERIEALESDNQLLNVRLSDKTDEVGRLSSQVLQAQSNFEHFMEASRLQREEEQQRFEQQQGKLEQTIHQIKQELNHIQQEKVVLQQQNQAVAIENNYLKTELGKLNSQYESILMKLSETSNELVRKTQDERHLQKQYEELQSRWDKQHHDFNELKTNHVIMAQQLASAQIEIKKLVERNNVLADEKRMLGYEQAQLVEPLK